MNIRTSALWIAIVLVLCIHLFEMQRKEGLYIDEVFTLMVCSGTYDNPTATIKAEGSKESGLQLRSRLLNLENTSKRLTALRNGTNDVMWTNIYYSMVQLIAGGKIIASQSDVFNICKILWLVNLLLLCFCMIICYHLLRQLLTAQWITGIGLLLMFGSAAVSMSVELARGFMLGTFAILCTTLIWYKMTDTSRHQSLSWKYLILLTISMAFSMLTTYTNLIFIVFLLIGWIAFAEKGTKLKTGCMALICLACALALCILIYPHYLDGFSAEGYVGTPHHLLSFFYPIDFLVKEAYLLWHLHKSVMIGCIAPIPFIVCIILWKRNENSRLLQRFLWLSAAAWITIVLSWAIAPYRSMRYVIMFLPIAMMSWVLMMKILENRVSGKWKNVICSISILLMFSCHLWKDNVELSHNPNPLKGGKYIEACADKEQHLLQCAMIPFAEDDAEIEYHNISHCNEPMQSGTIRITTQEPSAPQGQHIHRFLNVIK